VREDGVANVPSVSGIWQGRYVQKRLTQGSARVAGFRHDRDMSERKVRQHVTVVTDGTPVLSWHALQYPLGHAMLGEKKELSAVAKPLGR